MTRKRWFVEIVVSDEVARPWLGLLEHLKAAGMVQKVRFIGMSSGTSFQLVPPIGTSSPKHWAEVQSQRLRSFGVAATVASV